MPRCLGGDAEETADGEGGAPFNWRLPVGISVTID